jgi:hypothetical protein
VIVAVFRVVAGIVTDVTGGVVCGVVASVVCSLVGVVSGIGGVDVSGDRAGAGTGGTGARASRDKAGAGVIACFAGIVSIAVDGNAAGIFAICFACAVIYCAGLSIAVKISENSWGG